MVPHIKTTLDLPEDLLIKAKQLAAEHRTTLEEIVTRSLRREIGRDEQAAILPDGRYETGPWGILRLKETGAAVTPEQVQALADTLDEKELRSALD